MTQEEKARAYDEVREKIAIRFGSNVAEEIFSQFEMSEDERIRKALIKVFASHKDYEVFFGVSVEDILAWLEAQCEQKPADKVEPKFHEGDIIIHTELGGDYIHNPHKIIQVDILDEKYRLEGGLVAHFGEQDDYELVEQKPADTEKGAKGNEREIPIPEPPLTIKHAKEVMGIKQDDVWSEEDAKALNRISTILVDASEVKNWWKEYRLIERDEMIRLTDFLKSLKPQNRWKPSDEQLEALEHSLGITILRYLRIGLKC